MKVKNKDQQTERKAWSRYWTEAPQDSVCIPGAPARVADLLRETWHRFFQDLQRNRLVVDLATGSGAVLALAHDCRPDLKLTGVDYASSLTSPEESITILPEVRLEELPFADQAVDVVTSQFGLEYGAWPESVHELNRVLAKNGSMQLVCHHSESIIVVANRERLAAINDILGKRGLLSAALKIIQQRKIREPKSRRNLDRLLNKLLSNHPGQPVVEEGAQHIAEIMTQPGALKRLPALRRDIEKIPLILAGK